MKKENTWAKTCLILAGGSLLLLCICSVCIATLFYYVFDRSLNAATDAEVVRELCNVEQGNLYSFYRQNFTADYKNRVSFAEFKDFYETNKDVFVNCEDDLTNFSFEDLFTGASISYSNQNGEETLDVETDVNNKRVKLNLVKDNEDWLINDLAVE